MARLLKSGADIIVRPEVMCSKAANVNSKIKTMRAAFTELERVVNKTSNYWNGEAADINRASYAKEKDDIAKVFARLSEDVADLHKMAAQYSSTEQKVTELSNDLPSDVIV